jgi:hypothetical protein
MSIYLSVSLSLGLSVETFPTVGFTFYGYFQPNWNVTSDNPRDRETERWRDIETKRHRDRADNKNPEQS